MKIVKLIIGVVIVAVITAAALSFAKTPNSVKTATLTIDKGEKLYQTYCAACHGADLDGGMATSLVDNKWEYVSTNLEFKSLIKDGNADLGMPAFADKLSDVDIDAVHKFVNSRIGNTSVSAATNASQVDEGLLKVETWLTDFDTPWALVFTGTQGALVTEKTGNLFQIYNGKRIPRPVIGTPKVISRGQGGLLDVAVDPEYAQNKWVYLAFSHQLESDPKLSMTKVVRGHISDGKWHDEQVLFVAKPEHYISTHHHFGSRITFDKRGHMYFSIGDRGKKDMAQDVTLPNGKVHRLMRDGKIPKDNPFVKNSNAYPSIYSYGNRNPQGLIYTNGQLWESEHGPKGGDELNLVKSGANYGWPVISYGRNYSGTVLTPYTHMEAMEQPSSQWTPSIAACGLDVYTGTLFKGWEGNLLAGALKFKELRLINLKDGNYISEQILLNGLGRVRDVTSGPDGAIYVVLNKPGQILRLTPGPKFTVQ